MIEVIYRNNTHGLSVTEHTSLWPPYDIWCHGSLSTEVWLTHWGRVTHICVGKLTIIGSDNGLSPDRRQAIIWTNAGILLIGPLGTDIEILTFSFKKMRLKVSSAKRRPSCLGLNVLMASCLTKHGQYRNVEWRSSVRRAGIQFSHFVFTMHIVYIFKATHLKNVVYKMAPIYWGVTVNEYHFCEIQSN